MARGCSLATTSARSHAERPPDRKRSAGLQVLKAAARRRRIRSVPPRALGRSTGCVRLLPRHGTRTACLPEQNSSGPMNCVYCCRLFPARIEEEAGGEIVCTLRLDVGEPP